MKRYGFILLLVFLAACGAAGDDGEMAADASLGSRELAVDPGEIEGDYTLESFTGPECGDVHIPQSFRLEVEDGSIEIHDTGVPNEGLLVSDSEICTFDCSVFWPDLMYDCDMVIFRSTYGSRGFNFTVYTGYGIQMGYGGYPGSSFESGCKLTYRYQTMDILHSDAEIPEGYAVCVDSTGMPI